VGDRVVALAGAIHRGDDKLDTVANPYLLGLAATTTLLCKL